MHHAFEKKTQRTAKADLERGRQRFRDGPDAAEHLRIRSALMATLRQTIQERGLTQAKAATLLGVTQPRISDLMRGKIDLFSIDTLSTCSLAPAFK